MLRHLVRKSARGLSGCRNELTDWFACGQADSITESFQLPASRPETLKPPAREPHVTART